MLRMCANIICKFNPGCGWFSAARLARWLAYLREESLLGTASGSVPEPVEHGDARVFAGAELVQKVRTGAAAAADKRAIVVVGIGPAKRADGQDRGER